MADLIDMTGMVFGRLTVKSRAPNTLGGGAKWECVCSCGTIKTVPRGNLKNGHTQSCGCLHREIAKAANTKHKMTHTKEYSTWANMKERCTNPNNKRAKTYFGLMCKEWNNFEQFFSDMGKAPTPAHTIDRIDNSQGYCKENCRWATQQEQQNNRTNNSYYAMNGEWLTIAEWGRRTGIKGATIQRRVSRGWSVEDALTKPTRMLRR